MLRRTGRASESSVYQPPFGSTLDRDGVHFSVFSRSATQMRLLLYSEADKREPDQVIEFDPNRERLGDVWSKFVAGIGVGQLYHFQADGPYRPEVGDWFDSNARLIDPYAAALAGDFLHSTDGVIRPPKCVVIDPSFDWQQDQPLRRPWKETIVYEMHVAGFTKDPSSGVRQPGTYLGVIEKIPYLQSLGITAVELMPVHEFPILHFHGTPAKHPNYWGYDPLAFFAPHRGYASSSKPGSQVWELKTLIRELHRAGIEVILDVVFNHTCEGNERGPVLSMKGLENSVYYLLNNEGAHYSNYSGCGNTLNCNHPICRELILHCLRHWVHNYHVDGFRFDLASILSRDRNGNLVSNSPLIELISEDPLLSHTKLIAEAWDAAGAYQVGSFGDRRWNEWNGKYRDDLRRFWRGDTPWIGPFATRLCGSSDLYESNNRAPTNSINFVTSHDGFTLNDLVTYSSKHNEENGEDNRDGDNNNFSDNHGVEGPSQSKAIERKRNRQIKNFLASLLLSRGVPMLSMGDEVRRTQFGNNNAYCQDNSISWMNWNHGENQLEILRFVSALISIRKTHPLLQQDRFFNGKCVDTRGIPDVSWYDPHGNPMDWNKTDGGLMCWFARANPAKNQPLEIGDLLLAINPTPKNLPFSFPKPAHTQSWRLLFDTAKTYPEEVFPDWNGPTPILTRPIRVISRSIAAWVEWRG